MTDLVVLSSLNGNELISVKKIFTYMAIWFGSDTNTEYGPVTRKITDTDFRSRQKNKIVFAAL